MSILGSNALQIIGVFKRIIGTRLIRNIENVPPDCRGICSALLAFTALSHKISSQSKMVRFGQHLCRVLHSCPTKQHGRNIVKFLSLEFNLIWILTKSYYLHKNNTIRLVQIKRRKAVRKEKEKAIRSFTEEHFSWVYLFFK